MDCNGCSVDLSFEYTTKLKENRIWLSVICVLRRLISKYKKIALTKTARNSLCKLSQSVSIYTMTSTDSLCLTTSCHDSITFTVKSVSSEMAKMIHAIKMGEKKE